MTRYYCRHGSPSQAEANRCRQCIKRAKVLIAGDLAACADCEAYAPRSGMVEKADGRVICRPCQKQVEKITADRAQAALFDSQLSMF